MKPTKSLLLLLSKRTNPIGRYRIFSYISISNDEKGFIGAKHFSHYEYIEFILKKNTLRKMAVH